MDLRPLLPPATGALSTWWADGAAGRAPDAAPPGAAGPADARGAGVEPDAARAHATPTPPAAAEPGTATSAAQASSALAPATALASAQPGGAQRPAGAEPAATWQPSAPAAFGEIAAAPLTPVWVSSLPMAPLAHQPWPHPPAVPPRRRRRPRASPWADDGTGDDDAPVTAAAQRPGSTPHASTATTHPGRHAGHDDLPLPVQRELLRRRAVLVVAPGVRQPQQPQARWLGFAAGGAAVTRCVAIRAAAPVADCAHWQWWQASRFGDPGKTGEPGECGMNACRQARPLSAGAAPLLLRLGAAALPPPLRGPETAWIDLLEPQRLWRDLAHQWTWLIAWSPSPLPWME